MRIAAPLIWNVKQLGHVSCRDHVQGRGCTSLLIKKNYGCDITNQRTSRIVPVAFIIVRLISWANVAHGKWKAVPKAFLLIANPTK